MTKDKLIQNIRDMQEVLTIGLPMIKKSTVRTMLDCIIEDLEKIEDKRPTETYHEKDDCEWSRL